MEEVIEREPLHHSRDVCTVVPAALGDQIGDYACLVIAAEGFRVVSEDEDESDGTEREPKEDKEDIERRR
jgi:hypothetical protein